MKCSPMFGTTNSFLLTSVSLTLCCLCPRFKVLQPYFLVLTDFLITLDDIIWILGEIQSVRSRNHHLTIYIEVVNVKHKEPLHKLPLIVSPICNRPRFRRERQEGVSGPSGPV